MGTRAAYAAEHAGCKHVSVTPTFSDTRVPQRRRAELPERPVPLVAPVDASRNRSVRMPLIGRAFVRSNLRCCGRVAADNKFSGTLPASLAEMPSLRMLCAAPPGSLGLLPTDALRRVRSLSVYAGTCRSICSRAMCRGSQAGPPPPPSHTSNEHKLFSLSRAL